MHRRRRPDRPRSGPQLPAALRDAPATGPPPPPASGERVDAPPARGSATVRLSPPDRADTVRQIGPPAQREVTVSDTSPPQPEEEIEGLTDPEDEDTGWGDYPIDTVLIRTEMRTVYDVVRRIDRGDYIMDPDFQRAFIWKDDKQSKLIESVLMRIPLPVLYLAEDTDGRMIVVDGLQRLSTFHRFLQDKLALRLPSQTELHGKRFSELSPKLQNRIEDCNLVLYIVDAKVPERARLDIFERVNGGVPLTRQQMRNCLYMGPGTRFLRAHAESDLFREATGYSLHPDKMRDREFVNRFCAFQLLPIHTYSDEGRMDEWLARGLTRMNQMTEEDLDALGEAFRSTLRSNLEIFGKHAFRKHTPTQSHRSVLNASLWDVMSTGLAQIPESLALTNAHELRDRFFGLMDDDKFIKSITYGPNTANQVRNRFNTFRAMLHDVFDAIER